MTSDWARPVVHFEIRANDPGAQKAFYAALFTWDVGDEPFFPIGAGFGGPEPGPAGHLSEGEPGVTLYVQVGDLRTTLDRAAELGGAITGEPFDIPGGPTIASITDPEGNPVTLVQQ